MNRFADDRVIGAFSLVRTPIPIFFTRELLEELDLEGSDRASQVAGIRRWLETNAATDRLKRSLVRDGFVGLTG